MLWFASFETVLSDINLDTLESSSQGEKIWHPWKKKKDRLIHDLLCSKGLLPTRLCNKIALAQRKMETLLGAEFETLDWILDLNVNLMIFSINWLNFSLF